MTEGLRFSVIIPTFQRRDTVLASVQVLALQSFGRGFEVIVVVDGSDDGSTEALRSLRAPFPFEVLEQANEGAASARNRGAARGSGELLLFLDDDMEADPSLLHEHDASHRTGAQVVLGHVPPHPDSPQNFLSEGAGAWANDRFRRLTARSETVEPFDVLTGQLSVCREVFDAVGGFDDVDFTRDGAFGNEDLDFGLRLKSGGYRVVFNPDAVSYQRYVVGFRQHLDQWRDVGRADVTLVRRHPEHTAAFRALRSTDTLVNRMLRGIRSVPVVGRIATRATVALALALADRWPRSTIASRLFVVARGLTYWSGVAENGGLPDSGSLRVLSYHSIDTKPVDGDLTEYALSPEDFERQLLMLKRAGFTFVSPEQALASIEGRCALQRRSVLLSFDDGYSNFAEEAVPILEKHGIPAVVFVVTGLLGKTNHWDSGKGARARRLMSADDLHGLSDTSIEVGAHSRSHRSLVGLPSGELVEEIAGSIADLQELQLNRLRLFCYPYGATDDLVERELDAAGVRAAFTVEPGIVTGPGDRLKIPRIEIVKSDGSGPRFLWKVLNAGTAIRPRRWLQ